ncbi:hypothetical protein [Deinococcus sp.]|uniref:hypothetical protein n=1 Tax=Deinococcus sp. TaxID=47478 RepID=UPI0025BB44EC|nr:hypothetical protein [Deinococcus sp.]
MTGTHEQTARAAQHATLTPAERRAALARIEERRAQLTAELDQLAAIEAGHRAALAPTWQDDNL